MLQHKNDDVELKWPNQAVRFDFDFLVSYNSFTVFYMLQMWSFLC